MRRAFALIVALAALVPLAGCPGSLDDPGRFAAQFGNCPDVPTLFQSTCTASGCHAATTPAGNLDLASGGIFGRLSGKKASGGSGLLIDTADPSASVIYTKLGAPPPFGSRMPLTGSALSDTDVACVLSWIEAGGTSP